MHRLIRMQVVFFLLMGTGFLMAQTRDRIYIHTDRSGYVAGETIWFKTYLLSGLVPGSLGTNLLLDMVDEYGKRMMSGSLPIIGGIAVGNINLPLSLGQGIYFVRAYTKTQPAKDQYSSAVKTVYIFKPSSTGAVQAVPGAGEYYSSFRPSSGNLVAGITNMIYVNANDITGRPAAIEGTIVNIKNEVSVSFKTDNQGKGRFSLTPLSGEQYMARVIFADGASKTFDLPKTDENKVVVEIGDAPKVKIFKVTIPESQRNGGNMTMRGFMDDNLVFEKKFEAAAGHLSARIPVDELPAGLLQLRVTDSKNQTLGIANTFILSDSSFLPVQLHTDTVDVSPGGKNVFSFFVPQGTLGSFSVSITDYDKAFYKHENNIITGLLLNQDSRNHSFVSSTDVNKTAELEMAMGTADWLNQSLYAGLSPIAIDSDYITIRGKVINKQNKKPIGKGDISFMYTTKDSVTAMLSSPLAKDGSFLLQRLIFEDKQQFRFSINGNSWNDLEMSLDSTRQEDVFRLPFNRGGIVDRSIFSDNSTWKQVNETYTYLLADSISSTGLKEVVVKSRKVSPLQQVNDRYTRGLFNSLASAKVVDLINEPPIGGGNILDYLQGQIPGLLISGAGTQYTIQSNRQLSLSLMPPIRIFLNESETSINFLISLLPREVALVKYYPPGMSSLPGVGIAGVLSIYTKKASDGGISTFAPMSQFYYNGYLPIKDFTNDFLVAKESIAGKRTTLYWNPNLMPEEGQSVYKIRFNNSDMAKKMRLVVEGFTIDGRLVHFEKIIE